MAQRPPAAGAADGAPEPTPAAAQVAPGDGKTTPSPASSPDAGAAVDAADPAAEAAAALAAAQAEAAANEDKFLRARADLENYRRRMGRERSEVASEAKREVLLRVLDVMDNLERALGYEQSEGQIDAKALVTGLRMTITQFEDVLSGIGVQAVAAVGEQFDPHWHEAVATVVDPAQAEGTIVDEIQRGYHLGDVLLRPARVKVVASASETS